MYRKTEIQPVNKRQKAKKQWLTNILYFTGLSVRSHTFEFEALSSSTPWELKNYLILGDSTANGTEVTKQNSAGSDSQQWSRSVENDHGYFTFQNPISGKFLTASNSFDEDVLMITGTGGLI
mgnify:CR=1 FL=1